MLAMIGFVAVAALLLTVWALDDDSQPATFKTHTPGEPSATTVPAPTGDPAAGWERVVAPFGGQGADDVVVGPDGTLLAVGRDETGAALVMRSSDGRSWQRKGSFRADTGLTAPPPVAELSISVADGQVFVGGAEGLWRSVNGWQWDLVLMASSESAPFIREVGDRDDVLVAVGAHLRLASDGGWGSTPLVLLSDDGTRWENAALPTPEPSPADGDGLPAGAVVSVASNGDRLVAVGHRDQAGLTWASTDGRTWELSDALTTMAASVDDVLWLDDRWVAVGAGPAGEPAAWSSSDGGSWTALELAGLTTGSGGLTQLASGHGSLAALAGPTLDAEAQVWVSTDGGASWTAARARPEDGDGAVLARSLDATADGWMAVGSDAWLWPGASTPAIVSPSSPPVSAAPDQSAPWPPRGSLGDAAPSVPPFEAADATEQAVVDAVYAAFGGGPYVAGDAERFEGDLEGAFDEATEIYPEHAEGIRAAVYEVTIVSDTEAEVVFDIIDDGKLVTATTTGRVVLLDGTWTIAQATICEMMSRGGLRCP
jgi:hypothetical protein